MAGNGSRVRVNGPESGIGGRRRHNIRSIRVACHRKRHNELHPYTSPSQAGRSYTATNDAQKAQPSLMHKNTPLSAPGGIGSACRYSCVKWITRLPV